MFRWLSSTEAETFGKDLAAFVATELQDLKATRDAKYALRAQKVLARAAQRVEKFRVQERPNFYQKARLANAFLWGLKDAGCPEDYASELTDWLTPQL